MYTFEIRDLDCLTNMEDVEEVRKGDYPDMSNLKVGGTFVNARGQKLPIVIVPQKIANQLLHWGKIKIGWIFLRNKAKGTFNPLF